jgi:predicted O-methyltransferase YrrM
MALVEYLEKRGFFANTIEGFSQQIPKQVYDLTMLLDNADIKTAMEIGFNAGHSAEIFLDTNPSLHLTSFDLGAHDYVAVAKEYIDKTYPSRHTLVLGDSTQTIPVYKQTTYDLIFIDGGHDYDIAKADLLNCRRFAHENTLVLIDDTMFTGGWTASFNIGPTQAWVEAIEQGIIVEEVHHDYHPGRGMSWGRYGFGQSKDLPLQ